LSSPSLTTSTPVGVVVAQLGTPAAPTAAALRPYLRQFLSDPRVIDLKWWKWLPILYLFILTRRPARSARLYARIWTEAGSPLLLTSQAQTAGLQQRLGKGFRVILGMRYGEPNIEAAMSQLQKEGIERIVVLPMFPQFSCSTTASIYDGINQAAFGRRCPLFFDRRRRMPTLRFIPPYFEHPAYIDSLKVRVEGQVQALDRAPDRYLITFHGIPARYVEEGDPYRQQCERTAQLLATALGLNEGQWRLGFQSRFGKEPWLQPYTEDLLADLGREKLESLVVTCPGFTADCLETIDEIGHEGQRQFHETGGGQLHLVPCVNDHPRWLDAMATIVQQESAGWV
jgi:ferrochelatase